MNITKWKRDTKHKLKKYNRIRPLLKLSIHNTSYLDSNHTRSITTKQSTQSRRIETTIMKPERSLEIRNRTGLGFRWAIDRSDKANRDRTTNRRKTEGKK